MLATFKNWMERRIWRNEEKIILSESNNRSIQKNCIKSRILLCFHYLNNCWKSIKIMEEWFCRLGCMEASYESTNTNNHTSGHLKLN